LGQPGGTGRTVASFVESLLMARWPEKESYQIQSRFVCLFVCVSVFVCVCVVVVCVCVCGGGGG
jgi:hypothetical protein